MVKKIKWMIVVLVIAATSLIWLPSFQSPDDYPLPMAAGGTLDLSQWEFENQGIVPLQGEWAFFWMELLQQEDFEDDSQSHIPVYLSLPTELTRGSEKGGSFPANGYATLRLKVTLPDSTEVYGIKSQYLSSSSKIWVNGELLWEAGVVSTSHEAYQPNYTPIQFMFKSDTPQAEIIIQTSNYHLRRVRLKDIYLGTWDQVQHQTHRELIKDGIHFGSLMLVALYHFIVYHFQKHNRPFIYLAIISLITALRGGIMNERILIKMFPFISGEWMMKIGYFPVFALVPLFVLYIHNLFQSKSLEKMVKPSWAALAVAGGVILLFPVKVYDWLFQYGTWLIFLWAIIGICLLVWREKYERRLDLHMMIWGVGLVFFIAVLDFFRDLGLLKIPELLSSGILFFILLQAILLAWRANDAFNQVSLFAQDNELMYEEIQVMNQQLESKIKERTHQLEMANKSLEVLSRVDALTHLANRRFFDERMQEEWNRSIQVQSPLSMLMIDIDFFKEYNDCYGHLEGDQCLVTIAQELKKNLLDDTYFIARYGGEEFVVLLPNTSAEKASTVAERMRNKISQLDISYGCENHQRNVTISVGLNTITPQAHDRIEKFIDSVDKALYQAKDGGRNQVKQIDATKEGPTKTI